METKWHETFLIHSMQDEFGRKVKQAETIIRDALSSHGKLFVAYSGGKDSSVMLHLVLQQHPEILVIHWDYGRYYIPDEYATEILLNMQAIGTRNWWILTSEEYTKQGRNAINVLGREYIQKELPRLYEEGYTGSFIGLRKEESYKRRRRIRAQKSLSTIQEYFPVMDWSFMDIWAYIISNNLPYLSHYDRYAPIVGWDRCRFTTLFDPEFDKFGCSNIDGVLSWKFRNAR